MPAGEWFDFWTGDRYEGGRRHDVTAAPETIPLFVRGGSVIPLAEPTLSVTSEPRIHVRAYGAGAPDSVTLYADDGSANPTLAEIQLQRGGSASWTVIS